MSGPNERPPGVEGGAAVPGGRRPVRVRTLAALVACCGLIVWAGLRVWNTRDARAREAREIQGRALAALRSDEAGERLAAIQQLERLLDGDTGASLGPLAAALGDRDPQVRAASADALGRLGAEAVRAGTHAEEVRAAVPPLTAALNDPRAEVRAAAAQALGALAATTPAPARGAAAGSRPPAGPVDPRPVVAGLVSTLGDRDPGVRDAGRAALGAVGASVPIDPPRELADGLNGATGDVRKATADALVRFRQGLDASIPALIRLAEADPDSGSRAAALKALGRVKPSALTDAGVSALTAGLASPQPAVRGAVAAYLGRLGPGALASVPALVRVLREPLDPEVARRHEPPLDAEAARRPGLWMLDDDPACVAADALGTLAPGSEAARHVVAALREVLRDGPRLRHGWAAFALGKFGPDAGEAVPGLLEVVRRGGSTVGDRYNRDAAVWALARVAPDGPAADLAVEAIAGVLRSSPPAESQVAALKALRQYGPRAAPALPAVRPLLAADDDDVKDAAADAARALAPP